MRLQHALAENTGSQAHNRFQTLIHAAERRNTIQGQTGTSPIAARFRHVQNRGGIGQALFAFQTLTRQIKRFKLHFGHAVFRFVRAGKMAEFHNVFNRFGLFQCSIGGGIVMRKETGTVHTRVHFQPYGRRTLPLMMHKRLQLPLAADCRPQIITVNIRIFRSLKHAFQQNNRIFNAVLTQFHAFIYRCHRKAVGNIRQRVCTSDRTMPVSIGLNHGQQFIAMQLFEKTIILT